MSSYLKIHHTPNQDGMPQYTVIIDDGDIGAPERRTVHADTLNIIKEVAAYLADCEGGGER
jgi:hypothetical protein